MSGHISPKIDLLHHLRHPDGADRRHRLRRRSSTSASLNFPVALAIAITKATLVILFFMHVKYSSRLTKFVVASCLFFLACLFGLTMTDYLSRGWFTSPRGTTMAGTQVTVGARAPAAGRPLAALGADR